MNQSLVDRVKETLAAMVAAKKRWDALPELTRLRVTLGKRYSGRAVKLHKRSGKKDYRNALNTREKERRMKQRGQ